jgi:hypothetical protein
MAATIYRNLTMTPTFPSFSTSHGEAIRDVHHRLGVSLYDLAKWGGISYSTVLGWSNDLNGGPGWRELGLWMRQPELLTDAKLRLLRGILAETSLLVIDGDSPTFKEMDADADGDVDHHDVLIFASRLLRVAANKVADLAEAQSQKRLHADQVERLRAQLQEVIDTAGKVLAILDYLQKPTNGRRMQVA